MFSSFGLLDLGSHKLSQDEKEITAEPFLSALQNMGVEFLHGVENFHQGEVLFVQAAYNLLHAAKMHFMQLMPELFLGICTKISK